MKRTSILFVGRNSGTSRHRALALGRLGYDVCVVDPFTFLPRGPLASRWTWHTGSLFLEGFLRRRVLASIPPKPFQLVYVEAGEFVGPALVRELKRRFGTVVNYNIDDPFSARDGRRWRLYLQALPLYTLAVVLRDSNVPEAIAAGAHDVLRVYMSADEIAHAPRQLTEEKRSKWSSEVAFIGTWMPERGPFMARLIELGVPLSIYGCRWQKAPEWPMLRAAWRGIGMYTDDEYAAAIQCAKVNLGLLSKGNRDLSTTRSFEIPSLGGVLCAERTPEHIKLYRENVEAVFWSSPEECARKCRELLSDNDRRRSIGLNGRQRCLKNGIMNEPVLAQILDRVGVHANSDKGYHDFSYQRVVSSR